MNEARTTRAAAAAKSFALRVLGDSMAPEFNDGEIIIIEPDGALRDGSYVLAQVQRRMDLSPTGPDTATAGACAR